MINHIAVYTFLLFFQSHLIRMDWHGVMASYPRYMTIQDITGCPYKAVPISKVTIER